MRHYKLKHFDDVMDIEGSYGGRQQWFESIGHSGYLRRTGCGVIAAANIIVYRSLTDPEFDVYRRPLDKKHFTAFAMELARTMKPTPAGVFSATHMNHGIKKFTKEHHVLLLPMKNDWKWTLENAVEYIISGLTYDAPVTVMSWMNENPHLRYHWLIITELIVHDDGRVDMVCSNWGRKMTYDFSKWFYGRSLYQTIIYYL